MDIDKLMTELYIANEKAVKASEKYRSLADYIEARVDKLAKSDTRPLDWAQKRSVQKAREGASELTSYYNQYKFYVSEVVRINNLIQAYATAKLLEL